MRWDGVTVSPGEATACRAAAVLAAGVGLRQRSGWVLRAASFRIAGTPGGRLAVGIAAASATQGSALVDLIAGRTRPAHGELRVLGHDLTTAAGRLAVRRRTGVARRAGRPAPGSRVRGVVAREARLTVPGRERELLTAAILDRLGLTPWADIPVRAAPAVVFRRALLAAAAVHEPDLLLLDGVFDMLGRGEVSSLAASVRDLARDTAIIATGDDPSTLGLVCDEVLTLSDGILLCG